MRTAIVLVLLASCLVVPTTAWGIWVIVDQGGGGHYTTITEALANAPNGAYVRVVPGVYSASSGETMPIQMRSGLTLQKHHSPVGEVIIDGEGLTRCMECDPVDSPTVIEDITLRNGYAPGYDRHGAGLLIGGFGSSSSLDVRRVVFENNDAPSGFGGGVFADDTAGYALFSQCRFTGNTAVNGGGAYVMGYNPPGFVRCVFDNNSVTGYGGGLSHGPEPRGEGPQRDIIHQFLTFAHNSADLGSAAYHTYHTTRLWNSIIAYSTSVNDPIGVSGDVGFTVECCDVYGNAGGDYVGCIAGQQGLAGNIWDDPDFCGPEYEDTDPYSLNVNSPCTEQNNVVCGQIGARPVRCGIPYLDLNLEWLEYYIPFGEIYCDNLIFQNGGDLPLNWLMVAYEGALGRGWGGPDAFGYRWGDSDKPDGPDFEWNDITGVGALIELADDDAELVTLPFPFPFYENTYYECAVSSNGYLAFGADWTSPNNTPLPSTAGPEDIIAPFWSNLDPSSGGAIHTYFNEEAVTFTVQYTEIPIFPGPVGGNYTFQVVLYPDGTIRFYYLSMVGYTELSTIGIENSDGSIGLQVAYNEPYVHDDLAVIIDLGPPAATWVSLSLNEGTLDPGEQATCEVCVDAAEMESGIYEATLVLASNDYNEPIRYIPLTAEILPTGIEDPVVDRVTLRGNYPNPFNPLTRIAFDLPAPAVASLRIYDAAGRLVRTLFEDEPFDAGPHERAWNGRDEGGERLASGVYFYRLEAGGEALSKRMVLLK